MAGSFQPPARWMACVEALRASSTARPTRPPCEVLRPLETGWCAGEALDRDLLTRRDVERLFGVSRARAAQLMWTFGAEFVGAARVLRRTELLRQAAEVPDAGRPSAARSSGARAWWPSSARRGSPEIRVAVPLEALEARLAGLPEGVTVEAGRVEVRFTGAKEAVGKLVALAQALTVDYERFETIVGKGERSG